MREIKFRGQRVDNGKWVYGAFYPINSEDICFIIHNCKSLYFDDNDTVFDGHKVHPESVSQFTGHHDKNGKEIYEGDILLHNSEGQFTMILDNDFLGFAAKTEGSNALDSIHAPYLQRCEIIGSIHTTPELLNP